MNWGSRSTSRYVAAFLLGTLVAAVLSLGRLWVANPSSWSNILWAEDGLFAWCIRKADLAACTTDPFAGYLLLAPRLAALPTSLLPIEHWAISANLVSALAWGLVSGVLLVVLLRAGYGLALSGLLAVLPVIVPIVGFEATTSVASIYMPLIYALTIAVLVGPKTNRGAIWLAVAAGFIGATNPLTVLLLPVVLVRLLLRAVTVLQAVIITAGLSAGLILQAVVILNAEESRNLSPGLEALGYWMQDLPRALATQWPGLSFGESTIFGFFPIPVFGVTSWVIVILAVVLGVVSIIGSNERKRTAGFLLILGLGYSFIPTVTGYASNRYFVLTVLTMSAALLLFLFPGDQAERRPIRWVVVAVFLVSWTVAYPASAWRSQPAPPWPDELGRLASACSSDPTAPIAVTFSPDWPQAGVTELRPPTSATAPCSVLD